MVDQQQKHENFVRLLRDHQRQVFGYILALVHNLTDADDIFQRTCMVMWLKFDKFDEGSNFVRWACAVARLEVLDFLRARRRKPLLLSDDLHHQLAEVQSEAEADLIANRQETLATCLGKLSAADRQMVELCYGGEGTVEQAAANFGRSKHSVYNSLRRIRMALLECMRRAYAQESMP